MQGFLDFIKQPIIYIMLNSVFLLLVCISSQTDFLLTKKPPFKERLFVKFE